MPKYKIVSWLFFGFLLWTLAGCQARKEKAEKLEDAGSEQPSSSSDFFGRSSSLPDLEVGRWYCTLKDNRTTAFVMLDVQTNDHAQGRFYSTEEGPWATPHTFDVKVERRAIRLAINEGDTEKHTLRSIRSHYAFKPYVQPPFKAINDTRYRKPSYGITVSNDIVYGHAEGYWTSTTGFEDKSYAKVVAEGLSNSIRKRDLELTLDLYQPESARAEKHPLILFIHGGAFYVGDKKHPGMVDWCRYFASLGYVCASMNYRLGFLPSRDDIERAGYMAIQDAHAAMRFLVTHAEEYNIDTNQIYLGGTSAGSITALNLVFMDEDSRPEASRGKSGLFKRERNEDLGPINGSGNNLKADFHIRAIANMWGAVNNLEILKNSRTDIVSFHGDQDLLVPYDHGTPFSDVAERVGQRLFGEMYGSASIDRKAQELGLKSRLYTFPGEGHAFNVDKDGHLNSNHYFIRDSIASFFYREMVPVDATIVMDTHRKGFYRLESAEADSAQWNVEGGFVLQADNEAVRVLWRTDAATHSIQATGTYHNGIGFLTHMECEEPQPSQAPRE